MKKYLLLLLVCPISFLFAQNVVRKTNIEINSFRNKLLNSPNEVNIGVGKIKQSTNLISLPFPDGNNGDFQIVEYTLLPQGSEIDTKTFYGHKVDDNSIGCRITLSKKWIVATIYTKKGIVVIEKKVRQLSIPMNTMFIYSLKTNLNVKRKIASMQVVD